MNDFDTPKPPPSPYEELQRAIRTMSGRQPIECTKCKRVRLTHGTVTSMHCADCGGLLRWGDDESEGPK